MEPTIKKQSLVAFSDVHLEFYNSDKYPKCLMEEYDTNTLVIAGDFGYPFNLKKLPNQHFIFVLKQLKLKYKYIVYVAGNHEQFQARQLDLSTIEIDLHIRAICEELSIVFLQKETWIHPETKVCFAGCTLWSNIDETAQMNDFNKIFRFRDEYLQLHRDHSRWLTETIQEYKEGPMIVVTHHLPSFAGISKEYWGGNNTGYASNLDHLFQKPVVAWICGHTHTPNFKFINGIPLIINPIGYPKELKTTTKRHGLIEIPL